MIAHGTIHCSLRNYGSETYIALIASKFRIFLEFFCSASCRKKTIASPHFATKYGHDASVMLLTETTRMASVLRGVRLHTTYYIKSRGVKANHLMNGLYIIALR